MNESQTLLWLFFGTVIGVWVYAISLAIYLIVTSNWFAGTWLGQTVESTWNLITGAIQIILPPYTKKKN